MQSIEDIEENGFHKTPVKLPDAVPLEPVVTIHAHKHHKSKWSLHEQQELAALNNAALTICVPDSAELNHVIAQRECILISELFRI